MEGFTLWGISNTHVTTGTAATIENVAGINDKGSVGFIRLQHKL